MNFIAIIVCLLVAGSAFAQEPVFRVLVNKGQNQVKADGEWRVIKVGAVLTAAGEIKISKFGYLGLVHVSGRPWK